MKSGTIMRWAAAILLSVFLVYFSFPPYSFGLLMFVALIPFFMTLDTAPTWKGTLLRSWLFSMALSAALLPWAVSAFQNVTGMSGAKLTAALFAVGTFEFAAWTWWALLRHALVRHYGLRPLFWTPAAILFLEAFWEWSGYATGLRFFPITLGAAIGANTWLAQIADLTGVWGLTALVAATNEWGASLLLWIWNAKGMQKPSPSSSTSGSAGGFGIPSRPAWAMPTRKLVTHGVATALLVFCAIGYGAWRWKTIHETMGQASSFPKFRIGMIQTNVNPLATLRNAKESSERDEIRVKYLTQLLTLSDQLIPQKPDVLFWPESSYTDKFRGDTRVETQWTDKAGDQIEEYITHKLTPILFGADDDQAGFRYNSLFLIRPGTIDTAGMALVTLKTQIYHKSKRFPLWMNPLARETEGPRFSHGPGSVVFDGLAVKLGPSVFQDDLSPRLFRQLALDGAEVLINASNDTWFAGSHEPLLHHFLAKFRAIETRRPLVRLANGGVSSVIQLDGQVADVVQTTNASDSENRGAMGRFLAAGEQTKIIEVQPYGQIQSPWMMVSDVLLLIAGLWMFAPLLYGFARKRQHP